MQTAISEHPYNFTYAPLLIVISGASGSGKDSVVKELIRQLDARGAHPHFVVTTTTRPRRDTEVEGVDYYFVSRVEFERMIAEGELVEHALVYGQYKGVTRSELRRAMASGQDVVMRLDVQGAATIRQMAPEAILIFIATLSERELTERLKRRRTEREDQLAIRLETARQEMQRIPEFDYVIPNPDQKLHETVETVLAIITAEKHRTHPRRARI
ncbi:MAG: guanylate kinase [Anaerolineae bacterium]|nr:guanylate kinase [Anaerolineae bacterium]